MLQFQKGATTIQQTWGDFNCLDKSCVVVAGGINEGPGHIVTSSLLSKSA
jgi:hypothetical protein